MKKSAKVSIDVCDVFDLIKTENENLRKQIKIFVEFKIFFEEICLKLKSYLNENDLNRLKEFDYKLNQYFDCDKPLEEEEDIAVNSKTRNNSLKSEETNYFESPDDLASDGESDWNHKPVSNRKKKYRKSRAVKPREDGKYVCDYQNCGQVFGYRDSYLEHKYGAHGLTEDCNRTIYRCEWPGCDFFTIKRVIYNQHIDSHKGVQYECQIDGCNKIYKTRVGLKLHQDDSHVGTPFKCSVSECGKAFRSVRKLNLHVKKIHCERERTAVCDVEGCQFRTYTKYILANHKATSHSDNRPFKCSVNGCDKRYKYKNNLQIHESSVHNVNVIRFKCSEEGCDQEFKHNSGLSRHWYREHCKVMLRCEWPGCDFATKLPHNLKFHGYVHRTCREFECDWPACGKAFKTRKHLRQHMAVHKTDKELYCEWPGCQYRCLTRVNMKKHQKQVHQINDLMF